MILPCSAMKDTKTARWERGRAVRGWIGRRLAVCLGGFSVWGLIHSGYGVVQVVGAALVNSSKVIRMPFSVSLEMAPSAALCVSVLVALQLPISWTISKTSSVVDPSPRVSRSRKTALSLSILVMV